MAPFLRREPPRAPKLSATASANACAPASTKCAASSRWKAKTSARSSAAPASDSPHRDSEPLVLGCLWAFGVKTCLQWLRADRAPGVRPRTRRRNLRGRPSRSSRVPVAGRRRTSGTLRQQNSESAPTPPTPARTHRGTHEETQPPRSRPLDRILGDRLRLRIRLPALQSPARNISQELRQPDALPLRAAGQAPPRKPISPRLDHDTPGKPQRPRPLLWPIPVAHGGRKVHERLPRLLQNAPLRGRSASRSQIPRLHLFRDEDVPGPLLQGLQRRGILRRSQPRPSLLRFRRRISGARIFRAARRRIGESRIRRRRRHSCAPGKTEARTEPVPRDRPPPRPLFGADHSALPRGGLGHALARGKRRDLWRSAVLHSTRGAHKIAVHGIAGAGRPRFVSAREDAPCARNHGTPRSAQALVLSRPPHRRNISRGR